MSPATILIVDDEPAVRLLMRQVLEAEGYAVILAADGEEAWELLRASPPDLVITDALMPRMDGFALASRVCADPSTSGIPVIMVTSLGDVDSRVRAWEAGVDDFLSKPFHAVELVARTRSLCKVKEYHDLQARYRVQLEQTVRERTERLRQAVAAARSFSRDTVERLSRTAEYRDNDTGEHIKRLSGYAVEVARGMRLGTGLIGRLRLAVPLHDIGKVGIPDRILLKPDRLTAEEMEVMKRHTTIGARILAGSRSSTMALAEEIALTHHERWDGAGYPRGLSGDAIPVAGRVTAVVDVFDALCSKRPYKEPLPPEAAISIVAQGRSTHFDPAVVDCFLAARPQILRLQDRFRDAGPGRLRALDEASSSGKRPASPMQGVRP